VEQKPATYIALYAFGRSLCGYTALEKSVHTRQTQEIPKGISRFEERQRRIQRWMLESLADGFSALSD